MKQVPCLGTTNSEHLLTEDATDNRGKKFSGCVVFMVPSSVFNHNYDFVLLFQIINLHIVKFKYHRHSVQY
jgi:hypothetical protein